MKLYKDLLEPKRSTTSSVFRATLNAHGLYNTNQFVLRLSPVIHRTLAEFTSGITTNREIGLKGAQAMSTYLHETIHWWQHIGSTYGFIYSLNYPVQAVSTFNDLQKILIGDGFKKSILKQSELLHTRGPTGFGTLAGTSNIVINNHFDLDVFRLYTLGRQSSELLANNKRFEAAGHGLYMTYAHTVSALASSVDKDFKALPDFRKWADGFKELRDKQEEGYYYGSPLVLWPLGSCEIFEGQARFSQIQYLSNACGHNLDWQSYASLGMLDGIYVEAFNVFLKLTELKWPTQVNDPIVSLFLLICDLSINPGAGFPFTIEENYSSFMDDVNPGARFAIYCRLVATKFPHLKSAIQKHNRSEYEDITSSLADAYKDYPPALISKTCSSWMSESGPLENLSKEFMEYKFDTKNFIVRHLFAHFLAFQSDKFLSPQFFCWPGAHMAGDMIHPQGKDLFDKHGALFVDKEYDDGVFPRLQVGRSEAAVHQAFEEFYAVNVINDLVGQWINEPGPFRYDLSWLKADSNEQEQSDFMRRQFQIAYGVDPADAIIL